MAQRITLTAKQETQMKKDVDIQMLENPKAIRSDIEKNG